MSTTSTLGTFWVKLVDAIDTGALAGNVYHGFRPELESELEAAFVLRVVDGSWTSEIAGIKAGRKQRNESYVFEVGVWVAKPEEDSTGLQAVVDRLLVLVGVIEGALADDPQAGDTTIQWAELEERDLNFWPLDRGWSAMALLRIRGNARLT